MCDQKDFEKIVSFIRDLYHQPEGVIPLHAPVFLGNEKKYLMECIDSTYVSYVGEFVNRFERMIADYTGANYAVAVSNGTVALQISLIIAGIEPGDEVISQPLTFVATANAIRHAIAWPVFIDVDPDTLGMSPDSLDSFLKNSITMKKDGAYNKVSGRRIKAAVPMHTFGFPCRIDEIVDICTKYEIEVIEDAAESLGSFYKKQHTGTFGLAGIVSFNGNKIITTGGGGAIITNEKAFAERAKHLTTTAKVPHPWKYMHDEIGYNFRMPNLNAAVGVAQMEKIDEFIQIKRTTASKYKTFLQNLDMEFFTEPAYARSNYWLNTIKIENNKLRDEFLDYCQRLGVSARPPWQLLHYLPMYKNSQFSDLRNCIRLEETLANLPSGIGC